MVVSRFMEWRRGLFEGQGHVIHSERVIGQIDDLILMLRPLVMPLRTKYLFVPTRTGACAVFDNGGIGSDLISLFSVMTGMLNCAAVEFTHVEDAPARPGGVSFSLFDGGDVTRSVHLIHDSKNRWVFEQHGDAKDFEDGAAYRAKKVKDRLGFALLRDYARRLDADVYDPVYYGESATLVYHERA